MKVVAHRGYSARFPENSLLAFEQAIAAGADWVETDVRMTRDGILVCWHDPDLRRVTGLETVIAQTEAAELLAIDLPGSARISRLGDALSLVRGRVPLMLDVKTGDDRVRAATIEAVTAAGMAGEIVYGVRSAEQAHALSAAGARFALLAMPRTPDMLDEFPGANLIGARLWEDQVEAAALTRIRSRGIEVWVTAGVRSQGEVPGYITAERLNMLHDLAVDAVLVNDIGLAGATVRRHAEEWRG